MPLAARHTEQRLALSAALGLGLVLVVVVASAAIRLGSSFDSLTVSWTSALRLAHRTAASLEVAVVLWLGWMAWRVRSTERTVFDAALAALGLTVVLSVVGIVGGQKPSAAGAAANLLGGLALASVFAWLLGALGRGAGRVGPGIAWTIGMLLLLQSALGARISIGERFAPALSVHALLAVALAALLGWIALARLRGCAGKALFVLALAAPMLGFTALHYEYSALAALAHAAAAALLLASVAHALARTA